MSPWEVLLSMMFGAIGFLIVLLGQRLFSASHVRVQFRGNNERILVIIHQIVNSKNEQMLLEHELATLLAEQPVDRARWIVQMKAIADSVPPLVLQQMSRFGLAELPDEAPALSSPTVRVTELEEDEEIPATVTSIDAWTGRERTG